MVVIKTISFIIEPLALENKLLIVAHSISNKIFPSPIIDEQMHLSYKTKSLRLVLLLSSL